MFSMPCDVFIPAASSNTIKESVARQLSCKFLGEAANSPTTPGGDAVLRERGILVCPDIYASGGGVAVSWLEWVQNLQNFRYTTRECDMRPLMHACRTFNTSDELPGSRGRGDDATLVQTLLPARLQVASRSPSTCFKLLCLQY